MQRRAALPTSKKNTKHTKHMHHFENTWYVLIDLIVLIVNWYN